MSLHDVVSVENFVKATLNDSKIRFEQEEFDELVLEGIAILYQLADGYEAHRPGYAQPGRFSGYAARYLPRRLGESWHRLHPDHVYRTKPDGSREWVYLPKSVSLDAAYAKASVDGSGDSLERRFRPRNQWCTAPPA